MAKVKTYAEKLLDPRWQKKRLEILAKRDWHCEICCDDESTLHVHHKIYVKGRDPWEYDDDQLAVICDACHEEIHSQGTDDLADVCSRLDLDGPYGRQDVATIIAAIFLPDWKSSKDYTNRFLKTMRELGLDAELRTSMESIRAAVYRTYTELREKN